MVDITNLIIQKIALEGEKAVIAKLDAIKKAGTEAFSGIGSTGPQKSLAELQRGLTGVERAAVGFGFALRDASDSMFASFKRMAIGAGLVVGALTAAGVAASKFVDASVGVVDTLRSEAIAAGQAIDSFARLQFAFEQSGGKAEAFQRGLSVVNDAIGDVQTGKATDVTKTFERIGVALVDAAGHGRSAEDIFKDVADVMSRIENPADKAALAIQLFGRRIGPSMVELLAEGRKGIEDLAKDFTKLTGGITKEQGRMADAMKDAMNRVAVASRGTNIQLGLLFAPAITDASNRFADSIAASRDRIVAWGETVRDFLVPLIEDFVSLIVGEPEKIKSSFVFALAKAVDVLVLAVRGAIFIFQGWIVILDQVGKLLNSLFGTEFTGSSLAAIIIVTQLVGGFRLLAAVLGVVRTGVVLLGATTAVVSAPFLLLVAAALALGVALGLLAAWLAGGKLNWASVSTQALAEFQKISDGAKILWELLKALWDEGVPGLVKKWEELKLTQSVMDWFKAEWKKFTDSVQQNWDIAVKFVKDQLESLVAWFESTWVMRMIRGIESIIKKFLDLGTAKAAAGGPPGEGGSVQAAGGGLIRGRGTSRSDSIPAWLSNMEFVQRAKAVKYYGLDFMRAINNLRFPRFAEGGLVGRMPPLSMPRMSTASQSSMRPLTVMFGGETFEGLYAPEHVADKLVRASLRSQSRSGGRKPSWKE